MINFKCQNLFLVACHQIRSDGKVIPGITVEASLGSPSGLKVKSEKSYQIIPYSSNRFDTMQEINFQNVCIDGNALVRQDPFIALFETREGDSFDYSPNEDYVLLNNLNNLCKVSIVYPDSSRKHLTIRSAAPPKYIPLDNPNSPFLLLKRNSYFLVQGYDNRRTTINVYYIGNDGRIWHYDPPSEAELKKWGIVMYIPVH